MRRFLLLVSLLAMLPGLASAAGISMSGKPPEIQGADLPSCTATYEGMVYRVMNATSSNTCTAPWTGTVTPSACLCNNGVWSDQGGGVSGGGGITSYTKATATTAFGTTCSAADGATPFYFGLTNASSTSDCDLATGTSTVGSVCYCNVTDPAHAFAAGGAAFMGPAGPAGATGPAGAAGATGPAGPTGPSGASAFSAITTGTNTAATMTVGAGATLTASGGTINATTATTATQAATSTIADSGAAASTFPVLAPFATGSSVGMKTDPGLSYNASTNALTAGSFLGPVTGNASTATALAGAATPCPGVGEFAKGILPSGVATGCAVPAGTGSFTDIIVNGLGTTPQLRVQDSDAGINVGGGFKTNCSDATNCGTTIQGWRGGALVTMMNQTGSNGEIQIGASAAGSVSAVRILTDPATASDARLILPAGSISSGEILDGTILPADLSASVGGGNVTGPATSGLGNVAGFDNLTGTLLRDLGTMLDSAAVLLKTAFSPDPSYSTLYTRIDFPDAVITPMGRGDTWVSCTGAKTGTGGNAANGDYEACAFSGERVWNDFNDSFNWAVDHLAPGGEIVIQPGIYPMRTAVCTNGTRPGKSCVVTTAGAGDLGQCGAGGTCGLIPGRGYRYTVTYPSGKLRSGTDETLVTYVPLVKKEGAKIRCNGAADMNSEQDGKRTGCWILDDMGPEGTEEILGHGPTIDSGWAFNLGAHANGGKGFGEGAGTALQTTIKSGTTFTEGSKSICITAGTTPGWAANVLLKPGDWLAMELVVQAGNSSSLQDRYYLVDSVGTSITSTTGACTGSGGGGTEIGFAGTMHSSSPPTPVTNGVIRRMRPEYYTGHIELTGFTFAPNNPWKLTPFATAWQMTNAVTGAGLYGMFDHSIAAAGDGLNTLQSPDVDLHSIVNIEWGQGHRIHHNAIHSTSLEAWDGRNTCYDCSFDHNFISPGGGGTRLWDTGDAWEIDENYILGGMHNPTLASINDSIGDAQFTRNRYEQIGASFCAETTGGTLDGSPCMNDSACGGGTGWCYFTSPKAMYIIGGDTKITDSYFFGGVVGQYTTAHSFNYVSGPAPFIKVEIVSNATFTGNQFHGIQGTPIMAAFGTSARNLTIALNTFMYNSNFNVGTGYQADIMLQAAGASDFPKGVNIFGNRFIACDKYKACASRVAALRFDSAVNLPVYADLLFNNNVLDGYVQPFAHTNNTVMTVPGAMGSRVNIVNEVALSEMGAISTVAVRNANYVCDADHPSNRNLVFYVTEQTTDCNTAAAGTTNRRCYCNGAAYAATPP